MISASIPLLSDLTILNFSYKDGELPTQNISLADGVINYAPALTGAQSVLSVGTEDTPYTLTTAQLISGYTDADNGTLSVGTVNVDKGTVSTTGEGVNKSFTITPLSNYSGSVLLSYTVIDGQGGSVLASRSFTLSAVNDAPALEIPPSASYVDTVNDDVFTNTEGTLVAPDPDSLTVTFGIAGVTSAAGLAVKSGTYGVLTVNTSTGQFTYVPNNTAIQLLKSGEDEDEFTVTASDGSMVSSQVFTVQVTGADDPTSFTGPSTGTVAEDGILRATATLVVSDRDGEAVSGSAQDNAIAPQTTIGTYGVFNISADGVWTYDLSNAQANVQALKTTDTKTETFTVITVGGQTQDITITITGANDDTTFGGFTGNAAEDDTLTATGTLTVQDADAGDAVITPITSQAGTYGSFAINANGEWTYALNNTENSVQALRAGQSVTDTFAVTTAGGTSQNVVITIAGKNDGPTLESIADAVYVDTEDDDEFEPTTGTLQGADADVGDTLTYSIKDGTVNAGLAKKPGSFGVLTLNTETGEYSFAPDNAKIQALKGPATETFELRFSDGTLTASKILTVQLTGADDPTSIGGVKTGALTEDAGIASATGKLLVTDRDGDAVTGDSAMIAQTAVAGTYGAFSINAAGEWKYDLSNAQANVQALKTTDTKTETFTVITVGGQTQDITITITGANDDTTFGGFTGNAAEDDTLTATGTLTVQDADAGDAVITPITSQAGTYGSFAINANGEWTYALNNTENSVQALRAGQSVTDTFAVTTAGGTSQNVVITIAGKNDGPTLESIADAVYVDTEDDDEFEPTTGTLQGADADVGDTLTYSIKDGTVNAGLAKKPGSFGVLTLNTETGEYSFAPDNAKIQALKGPATETFELRFSDGTLTASKILTVQLTGADDPTSIGGVKTGALTEDAGIASATGKLLVTDRDGDAVTGDSAIKVQSNVPGTYGTFSIDAAGTWTYTLDNTKAQVLRAAQVFEDKFAVSSESNTNSEVIVSITGVNDAPTLVQPTAMTFVDTAANDSFTAGTGTLVGADVDAGTTTLTYGIDSGTVAAGSVSKVGTYGVLSLNQSTGVYSFAPNNATIQALSAPASETFTVTVGDGLTTTSRVLTVNVTGANDAPVPVPKVDEATEDDVSVTGQLVATDLDTGAALTFSLPGTATPGLTMTSAGAYTFDPKVSAYQYLKAGEKLDVVVGFAVTDGVVSAPVTSTLTLTVTGVNDAPVLALKSGATPFAGTEDEFITITYADLAAKLDATDVDNNPLAFRVVARDRGTLEKQAAGATTWTPVVAGENGTLVASGEVLRFKGAQDANGELNAFIVTAFDGLVDSVGTASLKVNLAPINDLPLAGGVSVFGGSAQGQVLKAAVASIRDPDGVDLTKPFTYQWQKSTDNGVNWTDINNATSDTLSLTQADVGAKVRVTVGFTDMGGKNDETVTSAPTPIIINVNDAPTGALTITGTVEQGNELTAVSSVVDADGLGTLAYQWKANGVNIATATTNKFTPTQAEVGKRLTVEVSYTDLLGARELVSSVPTVAVADVNDAPTGSVTISNMTPIQGDTLTAANTLADLDGMGSNVVYSWLDGATVLATGAQYTLTQADVGKQIQLRAAYTDGANNAEVVTSAATAEVTDTEDLATGSIQVSGFAAVGLTLTAVNLLKDADLASTGVPTLTYQWQESTDAVVWVDIALATSSTFVLTADQAGKKVRVLGAYDDGVESVDSVASAASKTILAANEILSGTVAVTAARASSNIALNAVRQNDVLTLDISEVTLPEDSDGETLDGETTYQWFADGVAIGGATSTSLTLSQTQVGKSISAAVFFTPEDNGARLQIYSASTAPVINVNDAPTGAVAITGEVKQGIELTAVSTVADADGLGTLSYQWKADGVNINSATGDKFTPTQAEVGKNLSVEVSYTDQLGGVELVSSALTVDVLNVNETPLGDVGIAGYLLVGSVLTASNNLTDADGIPANSIVYSWYQTINSEWPENPAVLATGPTFTLTSAQAGEQVRVVASYTDSQVTVESKTSLATKPVLGSMIEGRVLNWVQPSDTGSVFQWQISSDGKLLTDNTKVWTDIGNANAAFLQTPRDAGTKQVRIVVDGAAQAPNAVTAVDNGVGKLGATDVSYDENGFMRLQAGVPFGDPDGLNINTANLAYKWQLFNGTAWADITGATSATYLPVASDVGKAVRVVVSYTDAQNFGAQLFSSPIRVRDTPPPSATGTLDDVAGDGLLTLAEKEAVGGVVLSGDVTTTETSVAVEFGGQIRMATVTGSEWTYTLKAGDYRALVQGDNQVTVNFSKTSDGVTGTSAVSKSLFIPTGVLEVRAANSAADPSQPKGVAADVMAKAATLSAVTTVLGGASLSSPNIVAMPFGNSASFNRGSDASGADFAVIKAPGDSSIGGMDVLSRGSDGKFAVPLSNGNTAAVSLSTTSFQPTADPLSMTVRGLEPGATNVEVDFFLPINTSNKLPATLANALYYKFNYATTAFEHYVSGVSKLYTYSLATDANNNGKRDAGDVVKLRLTLTDGDEWDGDRTVNGIIVDPGVVGNKLLPTIAITSNKLSLAPSDDALLTFTLSEASADFELTDVGVTGGTLGTWTASVDGKIYTAKFTPAAGSSNASVTVASEKFTNALGNFNDDGAEANNTVSLSIVSPSSGGGGGGPVVVKPPVVVPVIPPGGKSVFPSADAEALVPGLGKGLAGDGNGDGILDNAQPDVLSVRLTDASGKAAQLTMVAGGQNGKSAGAAGAAAVPEFTSLVQVAPAAGSLPASMAAPLEVLSFTAKVAVPDQAVPFSIYVDPAMGAKGFWVKNAAGFWVNLASKVNGGAVVSEEGQLRIDFNIKDGGEFDNSSDPSVVGTTMGILGDLPLTLMGKTSDIPDNFSI